eukprot:1152272-Pelagomonas_calceolata.AAC.19
MGTEHAQQAWFYYLFLLELAVTTCNITMDTMQRWHNFCPGIGLVLASKAALLSLHLQSLRLPSLPHLQHCVQNVQAHECASPGNHHVHGYPLLRGLTNELK